MKKRVYLIFGLVLVAACLLTVWRLGGTYTVKMDVPGGMIAAYRVTIEQEKPFLEEVDRQLTENTLSLTLRSEAPGKAYLIVSGPGEFKTMKRVYVHALGTITYGDFFGDSTGGWIIPAAFLVYLGFLLFGLIRTYRADLRRNMYQYRNVRNLGVIVFLGFLFLEQLMLCFSYQGPISTIRSVLYSTQSFAIAALPVAFVLFALVTASNVNLMRREGRNWRNMLGCLLGLLVCLGTLFPHVLGEWLQRTTLVDVHNEQGLALYVELWVEAAAGTIVAYLECVLIGTIVLALKAARHIPAFDKDYILILGCQIKKDGSLTKLLKDRVDRAVEFAWMQKESTGKDIVFIPSGGRGPDEVMTEAAAMQRYLLGLGFRESQIMIEDQSTNTYENLRNSARLIRESGGGKIAFATTNYHVFRSGMLAARQGIQAEGIGSATKRYFWINAFIREFIATLDAERRAHLRVIVALLAAILVMVMMVYGSNNL